MERLRSFAARMHAWGSQNARTSVSMWADELSSTLNKMEEAAPWEARGIHFFGDGDEQA
jgi:hypothetical protein